MRADAVDSSIANIIANIILFVIMICSDCLVFMVFLLIYNRRDQMTKYFWSFFCFVAFPQFNGLYPHPQVYDVAINDSIFMLLYLQMLNQWLNQC